MENDQGVVVDLYVPRKCAATNRLITAKDHASVQINVAEVDDEGKAVPGKVLTYAFCGHLRSVAESDDSLNRLAQRDGCAFLVQSCQRDEDLTTDLTTVLKNVWSYQR